MLQKISEKELKTFVFENYYRRIELTKENSYHSTKNLKKKDLILIATKLIKNYLILIMLKNTIICFEKQNQKIG